jgi:hypothetical protein
MLCKRYPFIAPARSHGTRRLKGIALKGDTEPEPTLYDNSGDAGDREPDFHSRERKNEEKDIRSEKSGFGSPESPEPAPAPASSPSAPLDPDTVRANEDASITQARAILKTYTLAPNVKDYLEGIVSGAQELTDTAREIIEAAKP